MPQQGWHSFSLHFFMAFTPSLAILLWNRNLLPFPLFLTLSIEGKEVLFPFLILMLPSMTFRATSLKSSFWCSLSVTMNKFIIGSNLIRRELEPAGIHHIQTYWCYKDQKILNRLGRCVLCHDGRKIKPLVNKRSISENLSFWSILQFSLFLIASSPPQLFFLLTHVSGILFSFAKLDIYYFDLDR